MSKKSHSHKPPESVPAPPPAWRTWATVALLLHLTCLGIAFASNAGVASPFRQALRNVPLATDYLQALSMDRAYDFPLAGALPQDGYHRLVLAEDKAGELSSKLAHELPSEEMSLGVRRRRYEHLAFWIAHFNEMFEENLDLKTQLPHAVARRWLADRGTPTGDYKLLCERIVPKRWASDAANQSTAAALNNGSPNTESTSSVKPDAAGQSSDGVAKTLALRLLWEKERQDLLVSPVEESSQLAAVVEEDDAKPTAVADEAPSAEAPSAEEKSAEAESVEAESSEEKHDAPKEQGEPE